MPVRSILVSALLGLVAAISVLLPTHPGRLQAAAPFAQETGTVVVVPLSTLQQQPLDHSGGFLDILVNGMHCGQIRFDDPIALARNSDLSWSLDRPTLFPVCSETGGVLTLVTGEGRILPQRTITKGQRIEVTSLEPEVSPTGGATILVVNRGVLAIPDYHQVEWLDISADGIYCGRVTVARPTQQDAEGNAVFRLDAPGVPAVCSRTGSRLTFVHELGITLIRHPVVLKGARTMLAGLAVEPPSTAGEEATPLPPAAGTGNSQTGESDRAPVWAAAALAALLAAVALTARRRSQR
jgi:hypothetical protein